MARAVTCDAECERSVSALCLPNSTLYSHHMYISPVGWSAHTVTHTHTHTHTHTELIDPHS
jgi:hypothetical protein